MRFLKDPRVSSENKPAEREIRMMKLDKKISEIFRTKKGREAFCGIKVYSSTIRKNCLPFIEGILRFSREIS